MTPTSIKLDEKTKAKLIEKAKKENRTLHNFILTHLIKLAKRK